MLSVFPRGVLDEILNLIESVSEGIPSYSCHMTALLHFKIIFELSFNDAIIVLYWAFLYVCHDYIV